MSFTVEDRQRLVLPHSPHLELNANGRYLVRASSETPVRLGAAPLRWSPDAGGFVLRVPDYSVGRQVLHVGPERVSVRIAPRKGKLDPARWLQLIDELEREIPTASVGAGVGLQGQVQTDGVAARWLAEALTPLLPALVAALSDLLANLRLGEVDALRERPLHRARPATSWLVRHPEVVAWLRPDIDTSGPTPQVPVHLERSTLDRPANRAVVWLVWRLRKLFVRAGERLVAAGPQPLVDDAAWSHARGARFLDAARRLETLLARSPLARLQPAPPDDAALLVFADDPWYTRFHALARRFLRARFRLEEGGQGAPQKPAYDLYELWTYVALWRALQARLTGWSWRAHGLQRLGRLDSQGQRVRIVGKLGDRRVSVLFNWSFPGYLKRGRSSAFSISHQRRPDLVVTLRGPDGFRWVALDAKYRVGPVALSQAFDSVHRYAHGLRWSGRPPEAVCLLSPNRLEPCAPWYEPAYHQAHGCGVVLCRPGDTDEAARWVLENLGLENVG